LVDVAENQKKSLAQHLTVIFVSSVVGIVTFGSFGFYFDKNFYVDELKFRTANLLGILINENILEKVDSDWVGSWWAIPVAVLLLSIFSIYPFTRISASLRMFYLILLILDD